MSAGIRSCIVGMCIVVGTVGYIGHHTTQTRATLPVCAADQASVQTINGHRVVICTPR